MPRQPHARPAAPKRKRKRGGTERRTAGHFVGREASPVLERYPPKDPTSSLRPPPPAPNPSPPRIAVAPSPTAPGSRGPDAPPGAPTNPPVSTPLITLDRPFDVDEFAAMLGEPTVRVTVPRDALSDVLRRVTEFMGFGIYVYALTIRPAPSELLKSFVVELQRVDYSAERGAWVPFVDRGAEGAP